MPKKKTAISIDRKDMPSEREQRRQTHSESVSRPHPLVIARRPEVLYVRYFGHSRSDSFDACGPACETGVVLDLCFVQLVSRECLVHAVPYLFALGIWRTLPGMKLARHEKSNDDRWTRYLGPQRSRSTLRGGSAQKPCGNRIFEFAKA